MWLLLLLLVPLWARAVLQLRLVVEQGATELLGLL